MNRPGHISKHMIIFIIMFTLSIVSWAFKALQYNALPHIHYQCQWTVGWSFGWSFLRLSQVQMMKIYHKSLATIACHYHKIDIYLDCLLLFWWTQRTLFYCFKTNSQTIKIPWCEVRWNAFSSSHFLLIINVNHFFFFVKLTSKTIQNRSINLQTFEGFAKIYCHNINSHSTKN